MSNTLSSVLASCNSVLYGDILKYLYNSKNNFPSDKSQKWMKMLTSQAIMSAFMNPKQTKSTTPPANPLSWIEVIVKSIKAINAKITYLGRKYQS